MSIPEKFLAPGTRYYAVPECICRGRIVDGEVQACVGYGTDQIYVPCRSFHASYAHRTVWRDAWERFLMEYGDPASVDPLSGPIIRDDGPVALCEEGCPQCQGNGAIREGVTRYVSRDMALDACEPGMEGMPIEDYQDVQCDPCGATGKQYRIVRCEEMTGHIQEFLKADTIMDEIFCAEDWTREHGTPAAILCIASDGTEHLIERETERGNE